MLLAFIAFETVVKNRTVVADSTTISNTLFYNCSSEENGGAIYCGNSRINVFIKKSSFFRCFSCGYGAAIGIGNANFTFLESASGRQCSMRFNGNSPYGSFGIFWADSEIRKISVSECAPNIEASIGLHFQGGNPLLHCCNFTKNWNEYGWRSLVYFYTSCVNRRVISSVFMNNSSPRILALDGVTNYSIFINNNCSRIGDGTFYHCCFYGSQAPSATTLCVSDKIVYMTDYSTCEFSEMSLEFTGQKEPKMSLLVLLLMFGLL